MAERLPGPWNWIVPVVETVNGRATKEFLSWLSQQLSANKLIGDAVPQGREINTTSPLTGGGNLSSDLTLGFNGGLDDLNDVDLTTPPTDGQALVFDSGDGEWKPGSVAGGLDVQQEGVTVEDPATVLNFTGPGVTVTSPSAGQVDIDISGGGTPVPFAGALVYKTSTQSTTSGSTATVNWDAADYDTDGFFSIGSPSRFTIPSGVTRVLLSTGIQIEANSSGGRTATIRKNGTDFIGGARVTGPATPVGNGGVTCTSAIVDVTPGDYFEVQVNQTSGSSLNILTDVRTWFSIQVIPSDYGSGGGGGGSSSLWSFAGAVTPTPSDPVVSVTGSHSGNPQNAMFNYPINNWFWSDGVSTGVVNFDFGSAVTLGGIGFLQDLTTAQGTWQVSGSNDGVSYTNLGSPGAWGGARLTAITFTNTTSYRYYRLTQTSGVTNNDSYQSMFLFRFALSW